MIEAKQRAVVTVIDFFEQVREGATSVLVFGQHSPTWVAIKGWTSSGGILRAVTPTGDEVVFPLERPWTILPLSLVEVRPLDVYQGDLERDQKALAQLFGGDQTLAEAAPAPAPAAPLAPSTQMGGYL